MKKCNTCKETKSLEHFYLDSSRADGYCYLCKICQKARIKAYQKSTPEKQKAYLAARKKANPNYWNKRQLAWQKANPGKARASASRRRARKLQASPKWLTKEHRKQIEWFYETAQELQWLCEERLHVDHIHPLVSKNELGEHIACGLHVPWNLQIISASENCSKGSRLLEKTT